ncbi:MAG: hypothetical protein BGO67_03280 [Alphaproteobacteria bacterium 41-28]|nr:MAG: hypothetical protein BGO67_03280 [Alphaproteobacteria bacterium 41-28]
MGDLKLAQIEHLSQLFIFQIKNVHKQMGKVWFDMELARSDLRELIELHRKWEEEKEHNQEQQES